ncbi:MAG: ATP-binding protein [Meiothermus sp.]|uniref:ATP-binding protein n=1 Tax=Meiothermus sp. TaxID=1955249 RepID=UPI0025E6727C|nr:ATP-binding protein [Meiothermus sp.]MCS7068412.1 ATP-binding protein [Meiothermus sp.]
MRQVGMVLGSREAGALDFWVAVEEGQYLRLDDLVYVEFRHPDPRKGDPNGNVRYYGMVDQVIKLYEGAQFDTDVFLARRDLLPVSLSYAAHVQVTRLVPEEYLPPDPGSPVFLAQQEALGLALYYDRMQDQRLPVGLLKNGEVAYINFEFLNGFKGGHVNISGVSGVAAKTSYATFLLHSLFQSPANRQKANTKALIFNVKGEDLFYLDKDNSGLNDEAREAYEKLALPAQAFQSVAFLAPPRKTPGDILADVSRPDASAYHWDLVQFCREGLLPFLFTDRGAMSNLGFLIDQVTERLRRLVEDLPLTRRPSQERTFELEELQGRLERFLAPQLAEKSAWIQWQIPHTVRANPDAVYQALLNLLDNALKYGTGSEIVVQSGQNAEGVWLEVRNQGQPLEDFERLFLAGQRGVHAANVRGTGLGLALVRRLAAGWGGTAYGRALENGNAFGLTFPLHRGTTLKRSENHTPV